MDVPDRVKAHAFDAVDKAKDTSYFTEYLDTVRGMEAAKAYKELSFSLMALKQGHRVLDVGCGTGEDVLAMARIVGRRGRAVGVDSSQTMVDEAKKRSARMKASNVSFSVRNAERLGFEDDTFEGCRADRVFQHIRDPRDALREMIRVAKSGSGRIVVVDPDWESLLIDSEYDGVSREVALAHAGGVKNGRSGRRLYGMLKDAGLTGVTATALAPIVTDYDLALRIVDLDENARLAVEAGTISKSQAAKWLTDLRRRQHSGRFFACLTLVVAAGTKP